MKNKKAFTFVELIIVVTIITILGAIGFGAYSSNISDSRDSQRKSDLAQVESALKIYKQKRGYYPIPGNKFNITYSGSEVAYEGRLDQNVSINTLEKLPLDPKINKTYFYSTTKNKQEFELAATLENGDDPEALMLGNYKTVSKYILPTIMLANDTTSGNIEIKEGTVNGDINRKLFVYNGQKDNLVYNFEDESVYTSGIDFTGALDQAIATKNFWQNSDYRNCLEIQEAGKNLTREGYEMQYQIIDDTGVLTDTGCTFNP